MVSLRRDGFTMKAIAEKVGVSERTVRRYVRGVEPDIRMPSELDSNELTDGFYDQVLASRRRIVAIASGAGGKPPQALWGRTVLYSRLHCSTSTSCERILRATTIARHSLVCSSSTVSSFSARLSCVLEARSRTTRRGPDTAASAGCTIRR